VTRAANGTTAASRAGASPNRNPQWNIKPGSHSPLHNDLSAAANDVTGTPKLVSPPFSDQTGVTYFVFVKAPTDYYDRSIESRLDNLGAASIHHRCKRIVFVYCYLTHSLYFFIYHLNLVKFISLLSCNEVFGC